MLDKQADLAGPGIGDYADLQKVLRDMCAERDIHVLQ